MPKSLLKENFVLKETQCTIVSETKMGIQAAIESIKKSRQDLDAFVCSNPLFLHSLKPLPSPETPRIAKMMAEAARKADVGPMAAVAGAIADLAVEAMILSGCEVAVVEDGGEISAQSNIPVDVAVVAGEEPLSRKFGFRLENFPIGVATSSGRFSHALSFGDAEAATVFCNNACLADAAATAVGNVVKGEDVQSALNNGLSKGISIEGVEGVLIIYKGEVGMAGKIPKMIKVQP